MNGWEYAAAWKQKVQQSIQEGCFVENRWFGSMDDPTFKPAGGAGLEFGWFEGMKSSVAYAVELRDQGLIRKVNWEDIARLYLPNVKHAND